MGGDALEAVAVFDAALVRGEGKVETRRFEARIPVGSATSEWSVRRSTKPPTRSPPMRRNGSGTDAAANSPSG